MKKILRGLLAVMAFAVCMAGAISIPSRAEEAYTSENEAEATDAELQTTAGAELATVKNGWRTEQNTISGAGAEPARICR